MSKIKKLRPNLFIVGAPKCGTTSLASWLDSHPNIFMCKPKETYFFSEDVKSNRAAASFNEYLDLFKEVSSDHVAVGEASTTYLRSSVAVKSIEACFDMPKYIVCLRNPIDMAQSVYGQLLKGGRENEPSFERAWQLQEERLAGKSLPARTGDPFDLQYGQMCLVGSQLENMLQHVEANRVLTLFLEDMKNDPEAEYLRVLGFLGVEDIGWRDFTVENSRGVPKNIMLVRSLRFFSDLKRKLGFKTGSGIGAKLLSGLVRKPRADEKELDFRTRVLLSRYFEDDIKRLSSLTGKNLNHWMVH